MQLESVAVLRDTLRARFPGLSAALPRRVIIVGATQLGQMLLAQCRAQQIEIVGVFDGNPALAGHHCADLPIEPLAALDRLPRDIPLLMATQRQLAMEQQLGQFEFAQCWPFPLLSLLDARFAPHPFYTGLHDDLFLHRQEYAQLFDTLTDDISRATLNAVLGFRMTLDTRVLVDVMQPNAYFALHNAPDPQAVFVDGGAYTGDTIRAFMARNPHFQRIVAFEPDAKNFRALAENFARDARIALHAAGLYAHATTQHFQENARGSALCADGGAQISLVALDDIAAARNATFIKLNIEGAEPEALAGARQIITSRRPILAIAAYHRPDHLWRIPKIIRGLCDEYTLHLRQHDGGLIESVWYATAISG